MDNYTFGYPTACTKCSSIPGSDVNLKVEPFYKGGNDFKLMLIGQDPTIFRKPERVTHVLMLNNENSQLSRWLKTIFGKEQFESITIYATNLVKCSFKIPPSTTRSGGLTFLKPYFQKCAYYLQQEIMSFQPSLIITLGEPAHKLFTEQFVTGNRVAYNMKDAFTGTFYNIDFNGLTTKYTPCLHIKTFRVAETYGNSVNKFKSRLRDFLNAN